MNPADESQNENLELDAPKELLDDLGALYRVELPVPPEVDRAIIAMARERLAPRRRLRLSLRWAWAGAVAAAVLLAVWIAYPPGRHEKAPLRSGHYAAKEDFDGSGRVDILDAFALAREIESGRSHSLKWDMNGDGFVDRGDVDAIAMAAVSLKKGT